MAIDRAAVGQRVSVRRRVEGGLTDVLGHLLDVTDDHLDVLSHGEVLALPVADVTAAKVVPPATPRRGWAVPQVSPDDLQRICWAGWPARDTELLGDWALRAHAGITGRANSAMTVGDPGRPVTDALDAVAGWYAERGLPPLLQLPLADPVNRVMADAGWALLHVTVVQVAPIAPMLDTLAGPTMRAVVEPTPSADWLSLMHDLDDDVGTHVEILTGPAVVGFATLYRDDQPLGIGRVSVEGEWAGVTSVDVAPAARRQGIGSAVMHTLLSWAAQRGAVASYLQVRAGNPGALKLYDALGYVTHHPYNYRAPTA
ncbi:MAG TPA: GNAT family N-acetyltransferase [Actinomycetes bacterium]|nr:GNAT family N-acetyltransferase [Actinomycetes bacterium]